VIDQLKATWKSLRNNFWGSLAFDVVLIITAFLLVSMWQTRNLPDDDHTPPLELAWLDNTGADPVMVPGQVGVIYFFAPWCFYCRHSINNLNDLVDSKQLAWARVVALEYESLDEVREFIDETAVDLPVMLGGPQTTKDWQIRGFPTYFVIDGKGTIVSRSVGYSTKIGLKTRVWISQD
jgi:thiol-disulfide isomerase/thioredoxin